jgi:hypothetical protein
VTGPRKIEANRKNARASTGPKTREGRAHVARNALRHGLSIPLCSDPASSEQVEALARRIVGADASAKIQGPARDFAEAQIDVLRVRCARERLLCDALNSLHYESRAGDGPQKLASILSQQTKKLLAMGRYERRAVYRRKRAIRALDEAHVRDCNYFVILV